MGEIIRYNPDERALRIQHALDVIQGRASIKAQPQWQVAPAPVARVSRVDVLRGCATHPGKLWAAVYIEQAYAQSIQVTPTLARTQYAPGNQEIGSFDCNWITEETCAWCGSISAGPIYCRRCEMMMCRGLCSGNFLRCSCGNYGYGQNTNPNHMCFVPKVL